jgi:hypothetical protein
VAGQSGCRLGVPPDGSSAPAPSPSAPRGITSQESTPARTSDGLSRLLTVDIEVHTLIIVPARPMSLWNQPHRLSAGPLWSVPGPRLPRSCLGPFG